jgi:hypothetical protein
VPYAGKISRAKAQRLEALPLSKGFLCAFVPLREKYFSAVPGTTLMLLAQHPFP